MVSNLFSLILYSQTKTMPLRYIFMMFFRTGGSRDDEEGCASMREMKRGMRGFEWRDEGMRVEG